jgi:GTP:adenosylcobinamide-phosphate guanylyltransferase
MTFAALVLAGSRGEEDPVAAAAGVSHKGLATVGGRTMLARVIEALDAAGAGHIGVVTADPAIADAARALQTRAPVEIVPAAASPSLSVQGGLTRLGAPLLVTTVDHALLRPEWIADFLQRVPPGTDIAALLGEESVVQAAAPGTRRTYLAFRDGRYSGCNLFYLATPGAAAALELWRRVEVHRKEPWRMALLLGLGALIGYLTRRLTLGEAVAHLGRKAGVTATAVITPYGLAAVDVDKPSDLDLARSLERGG